MPQTASALELVRDAAQPITGAREDYDPLLRLVGDARFVLLGEASHGTHDFYAARAEITRRLIEERDFNVVAVEADWPDAYRANRYTRGGSCDPDADRALSGFRRFPTWMWRNTVVRDFIEWLRGRNATVPPGNATGFYGMDLYSLSGSIEAVLRYLDRTDPEAARRARARYACFEHFASDPQTYGYVASFDLEKSCESAVVEQLVEMRQKASLDTGSDPDERFAAEQNARLVRNAERYYRTMFGGRVSSWNMRDRHMVETIDALAMHVSRHPRQAKVVVWAHNSHLGDARATEMGRGGELNVGQLLRERHGDDAVLVGFTTHQGTVTAAHDWDEPPQSYRVRPSLPGSWERLLHDASTGGAPRFLLDLRGNISLAEALSEPRLERAIGVVYRPETERQSHYFHADLAAQFDAIVHFDTTTAVVPLDAPTAWHRDSEEPPETYPAGL